MWNRFPVPEPPRGLILSRIGWNGAENETGWGPEIETGWGRGQNATGWGQPWGCPWAGGCPGLAWQGARPWYAHESRVMTVETPGPVIEEVLSHTASTCSSWTVVSQDESTDMTVETPGPVIEEVCSDTASTCSSSWTVVSQRQRSQCPPPPPPLAQDVQD